MLIDRIRKKVQIFLNTDGRGNFSPTDFNLFLHDAMQSRYEDYIFEINRLLNRQNRGQQGSNLENLPDRYREKVLYYLTESLISFSIGLYYNFPEDYRYLDALETDSGYVFEMCKNVSDFNIIKTQTNKRYPIYVIVGNRIKIYPETIENITASYLRQPKLPKWTFVVVDDVEQFNPDADDFQDADIHPSEEDEMVKKVLLSFGVNIKEKDIQSFALNEQNSDFNKNNQV